MRVAGEMVNTIDFSSGMGADKTILLRIYIHAYYTVFDVLEHMLGSPPRNARRTKWGAGSDMLCHRTCPYPTKLNDVKGGASLVKVTIK